MGKSILVIITILALSASGALAARRTHHRHASPALLPSEGAGGLNAYTVGPRNSNDRAMYIKNLRDSGYNPTNDVDRFGNVWAVPDGGG